MDSRYTIGIDLGTTNSVVAYAELTAELPELQLLEIPQVVAAGQVESRQSLPSFLYLAAEHERAAFQLPWQAEPPSWVVGELARQRAAEQPQRVVAGAKSWLAHHGVDRREPILPWEAPDEIGKISPLTATEAYLQHLVAAWNHAFPDAPLADQRVVLTVPASFDPAARDLTSEAARRAGLPDEMVLLEEPQAAVYRWLRERHEDWREELGRGDSLLVVDVGGGTTDLTLIRLDEVAGNVELQRQAVGNHLLVGGDNMDLALAHLVAGQLAAEGHSLDPWQNVALWHACRTAKEQLLAPGGPSSTTVSVLGRGSRLIGGTISTELSASTVVSMFLEGFFPACEAEAKPQANVASGFQDIGLPYESDPAVTRHLAAFLAAHRRRAGEQSGEQVSGSEDSSNQPVPSHLLFNGGVFRAAILRDKVSELIELWSQGTRPRVLGGPEDLDHSVALGAAFYGWSKQHGGIRIRGGTARSYYIGIETAGLAIPGAPRPLRALCVAPQGMEEGTAAEVPSQEVGIVVGRPAQFRFFSSTVRRQDVPGTRLDRWSPDELVESDPIQTTLDSESAGEEPFLPVRFQSRVTELGVFELYCQSTRGDERWKMEFNTRDDRGAGQS
ncbi:Hsp70 family protein [Planctomycetaceae bacterium SH139]